MRIAALAREGRDAQALAECRALVARYERSAELRFQLGVLLLRSGDRAGAESALRESLAIAPGNSLALSLLGDLLFDRGEPDGAARCFEALAARRPREARVWSNLAAARLALGELERAESAARRARALDASHVMACLNLGRILAARGDRDGALEELAGCVRLDPRCAAAHDLAGRLHAQAGRYSQACIALRAAREAGAGEATLSRLGDALMQLGDARGAIAAYLEAQSVDSSNAAANGSRALFAMHCDERLGRDELFGAHRAWAARHAHVPSGTAFANDRDPGRRLRVGYVSPRLHRSSATFVLLPALEHHDPREVELFCYAQQDVEDDVSARIRSLAAGWRDTRKLDDEALAEAIREDAIDIVIDLAGHTPDNRLAALSLKPAPVALTWLDYFDTTGCAAIDAVITDSAHLPPGDAQPFVERRLRIDPLRFCYAAPGDAPLPTGLPSTGGAGIVFGAFHRFAKIGPAVIRAWAEILSRIPDARLVIKNDALNDEGEREYHRERLASAGLPMERVELRGASPHRELLAQYADIDIALDAFPYNGGITTFEALWMGRPVLAVRGGSMISRQSAAILRAVGLDELVAPDVAGLVELAGALVAEPDRLSRLADGLRERMAASPACDAPAFTRKLEAAYRQAWRAWCAGEPVGEAR